MIASLMFSFRFYGDGANWVQKRGVPSEAYREAGSITRSTSGHSVCHRCLHMNEELVTPFCLLSLSARRHAI